MKTLIKMVYVNHLNPIYSRFSQSGEYNITTIDPP